MDFCLILTGISVVYGAFSACGADRPPEYINAYSSVSHCGMVLLRHPHAQHHRHDRRRAQMLSHGLMTALFFALIGMIYGRTYPRHPSDGRP